jgi:YidC/Oxa1 family membrane protein insertase
MSGRFGVFAPAAIGEEELVTIENDVLKLDISTKGGQIRSALLKEHFVIKRDSNRKEFKEPLYLLNNPRNDFSYILNLKNRNIGEVATGDLFFTVQSKTDSRITLRAPASGGGYIEQTYALTGDTYVLDYNLSFNRLNNVIESDGVKLHWDNYLNKLEKNDNFERMYSSVYYKAIDDDPDYCNCRGSDEDDLTDQKIKWVAHANQFFSTNLVANDAFGGGLFETRALDKEEASLKMTRAEIAMPFDGRGDGSIDMTMYIGPNKFDYLEAVDPGLTQIIPFGRSILGTINRWVVRPFFNFLLSLAGTKGLTILFLTFLVKMLLYPLTYKMLHSQAKMGALKPEITKIQKKHGEDKQAAQVETMKIYREYGASPFGGCLPMLLQMPIWFALYRFFPASFEFRQASFLWANDLSSYDSIANLPFSIPMMGDTLSLFTILYGISLLIYTYYNSQHMDLTATNPMFKYIQYFMPVGIILFLNQYASGLTAYMLFSNLINISQTIITKKYIFNEEKIKDELRAHKAKPKKKGGFSDRLEKAMNEQKKKKEDTGKSNKR